MTKIEYEILLDEFLSRWPIDEVKNLKLKDYVGVYNKDTFCQWVETKTRMLGSIKGMTSIKFGIYERKDVKRKPKNYENDENYSWLKGYGENREIAFQKVKKDLIDVINFSLAGKFESIDEIKLPDLYKWKVAFLFSNERLIPIYNREVLFNIARHFGINTSRETKLSDIHRVMISNKPVNLTVYEFMIQLYSQFGNKKDKEEVVSPPKENPRRTNRKATLKKNTNPHVRTIDRSFIVSQKHNIIQEALKKTLVKNFGEENVILEENNVDVKLIQPEFISFYEVKSASYAADCVKQALGQLLMYSINDKDERPKKHFVVGQYPAGEHDMNYINFLKQNLKLEFDYLNVDIE